MLRLKKFKKILPILVCLIILIYIFGFTPYPVSWEQASTLQILAIFIPLLIIFTLLADFIFHYLPRSFILGLGLMFIFVLQALAVLNFLLVVEILAASILAARLFPKIKFKEFKNIPKLRLSSKPKESTLPRFRRRHKP